jgi:uncharacterized Zn finger protein
MNWFNVIKAIRCPECKQKTLETKKYSRPASWQRWHSKDSAIMECTNCGHVEVFK